MKTLEIGTPRFVDGVDISGTPQAKTSPRSLATKERYRQTCQQTRQLFDLFRGEVLHDGSETFHLQCFVVAHQTTTLAAGCHDDRPSVALTGRPPTQAELDELAAGVPLESMVDRYLESDEFRDFYFHRIRLQLESQGTEVQDEPVRLWCYVAFQDLPFQQILTADYTVDADFEQKQRAAHHGKTGLLTMKGFIQGKPGLPHYNYSAQVSMLFLGYIDEVPPEIVEQREGITALGTTDPNSVCFSCHKILTPLAFQRLNWMDDGSFRLTDEYGLKIDATDRGAVADYPFRGNGMEAFSDQAVHKERFIRTMINTHVNFYFGRPMRHLKDERTLYKRLWDNVHEHDFKIRELIRAIVTSPEYLHSG